MTRLLAILAVIVVLTVYTKLIWQSGFDQGADVSLCVVASLQNGGHLAVDDQSCRNAHRYREGNPLWVLRRRRG